MSIRRMQQYARLLRRGDATRSERRALLEAHRDDVNARVATLLGHLGMIEKKIRLYADAEMGCEVEPGHDTHAGKDEPRATLSAAEAGWTPHQPSRSP